mmetsp:Transcript_27028/g.80145  ORF Transcript_27028/g.80145 Transcript_27028/m.80145 type:complete len:316 (+) Transcript_27028:594-1541(+)
MASIHIVLSLVGREAMEARAQPLHVLPAHKIERAEQFGHPDGQRVVGRHARVELCAVCAAHLFHAAVPAHGLRLAAIPDRLPRLRQVVLSRVVHDQRLLPQHLLRTACIVQQLDARLPHRPPRQKARQPDQERVLIPPHQLVRRPRHEQAINVAVRPPGQPHRHLLQPCRVRGRECRTDCLHHAHQRHVERGNHGGCGVWLADQPGHRHKVVPLLNQHVALAIPPCMHLDLELPVRERPDLLQLRLAAVSYLVHVCNIEEPHLEKVLCAVCQGVPTVPCIDVGRRVILPDDCFSHPGLQHGLEHKRQQNPDCHTH